MQIQELVEHIGGMASVYAFDIMPDGSYSEIRLMGVNKPFSGLFALNPNAPKFTPGMPYRYFFHDVNFESFCYKCASTGEPLYSYVNAHGSWLSGIYFPVLDVEDDTASKDKDVRTVYCCYILKYTKEPDTGEMSKRSTEVSTAVLNISINLHKAQDFYKSMADTAREIRKICASDICSIVLVDKNDKSCTFINEDGVNQEYLQEVAQSMGRTPYEMAMAWEKALAGSDCFLIDDFSIIKERDIKWYESLMSFKIKSIVLYAVNFNNELVGFIWAANFDISNMMHIKETLELTTFFIGAVIANHQLLDKLEFMSMVDMLTKVRNRNAMNKRVDQLIAGGQNKPDVIGVVFADINGLKTVNDEEGHDAGDALLKRASKVLRKSFGEYEIYRAGGDEFVIFCPDITEEELEECIGNMRRLSDETNDVSFAVGSCIFSGDYDICAVMQNADAKMYADKEEYYRQHPEKKHRSSASA